MNTLAEDRPAAGLSVAGLNAIDCDVHPRSPGQADLMPFLDAYWQDMFPYRGIDRLELVGYPSSARPFNPPGAADAIASAEALGKALLDPLDLSAAILNLVNGVQGLYDPYMQAATCGAMNRWLASEWLDRDPRLRASLLVPFRNPEAAAEEIRRYRDDKRFVQILALSMGEEPLGRRTFWPIYDAAAECGFALCVHSGSAFRHAPTQSGFPSYLVEDIIHYSQAAANSVASLLAEGVLDRHPEMTVVMAESGASWLFATIWRLAKEWRGIRTEVPWIKSSPEVVIERQVRTTIAPFDAPPGFDEMPELMGCMGGPDQLLFATDFPHDYQRDVALWPAEIPADWAQAVARDNVLKTYPRLEV
ncbi:amidohydrolase family protein [Pseudoruegeria sp. HB172150]|uniref:amidohydrolase family protein n=1 Tax=Pseudoruegeria sp. HB172150 TaxID=2721164 RepID=UPI0015518548|nr:amidohydrolase family protein [Pseudoruegeria sp. HB172150]